VSGYLVIPTCDVASSFHDLVSCSPPLFFHCSSNLSNLNENEDVVMPLCGSSQTLKKNLPRPLSKNETMISQNNSKTNG
jgi:hypothetical protein